MISSAILLQANKNFDKIDTTLYRDSKYYIHFFVYDFFKRVNWLQDRQDLGFLVL